MGGNETQKLRVLLIHNFLSPYRIPLFRELAQRFDLNVWILGDIQSVRDWPADAPDAGFRYRVMPHFTIPLGSRYNVILLNHTVSRELREHKPDAIICCGWDTPVSFYAARYARKSNTPFILWSGSTHAEQTALRSMTRPVVRWLVRRADAWLAYGTRARDYLVSLGAEHAKTYLAYNTVETSEFAAASEAARSGVDALRRELNISTRYVALYCGNLLDLKGVGDLIAAFSVVAHSRDDITLVLVGSGKHEPKYRAQTVALGIDARVVFAGFAPRHRMPEFYALGDVLMVPSRSEVWGLVINEALACGLPVIASDACGAVPDLIHPGINGAVVPARNTVALAEAMDEFFSHPERHSSLREAARATIASFPLVRTADAFVAAVKCALSSR